ncbi:MAG: NAD-dependent epimerase/dehydratase family protein [Candidatus Gastranaerophilaceae bacterium]
MCKKILVTGAGGYIGQHVVKALLDKGADVIATDIRLDDVDDRATKVQKNIFEENENIFTEMGSPDVCLHMAWRDGFIHNSEKHIEDLDSHYKFISSMMKGGLKQMAVMGSMHEVGYYEGAIDENTPTNPLSLYGIAKNTLRQLTFLLGKNENVIVQWIRGFYIFGDDLKNNSIFKKIVEAEQEGKTEFPFTSGKNKYDFLSIYDMADQIAEIVLQDKINGIINSCTGQPMTLAEKVESFIKENNFKIKLKYGAYPDRPYDSPGIWGDATKINEIMKAAK